jgi:hypothetical protein
MALREDALDPLRYLLSGVFCALGGARDSCVRCVTRSARGAVVAVGSHGCLERGVVRVWRCSCTVRLRSWYLLVKWDVGTA